MSALEKAAWMALERLKKLDQRSGHPNNRESIAALEAALEQAEPVDAVQAERRCDGPECDMTCCQQAEPVAEPDDASGNPSF